MLFASVAMGNGASSSVEMDAEGAIVRSVIAGDSVALSRALEPMSVGDRARALASYRTNEGLCLLHISYVL